MPRKAKTPCHHPGCPNLTENYYCDEHAPAHAGDRASGNARGYNSRWQRARKRYLLDHPLCVKCYEQGIIREATVVDHIIPHRGDEKLFWDKNNWQALCKRHHDKKTMTEDRYQVYHY